MAATADSAALNGRGRSSANIVIAGDRTADRRQARLHTRFVRLLKVVLPLTGLVISVWFTASVFRTVSQAPSLAQADTPEIVSENLKMKNPHYEGFNNDGGRYWVRAVEAQQDLKSLTSLKLFGITGELTDANKKKTTLAAKRGLFDSRRNLLELYDQIDIAGDGGLTAKLKRASVKTKEGIITSNAPVDVSMEAGRITANQMTIRQKTKEYTFIDEVNMRVTPKEEEAAIAEAEKKAALPFGKPGKPIDIASNRLDIDDDQKSAIFAGGVTASQDGASLNAAEMTVSYEGQVTPGSSEAGAQAGAPSGGKVKSIIAKDNVTMKQTTGETASARTATFDAENKSVILEGDVAIAQEPDKRAVGDRVEYDQAAETMVLTGPVVVSQGTNELRGRRLVLDRTTGKLQLTGNDAGAGGRISAHFEPNKTGASPPPREESDSDGESHSGGIPFGPTFKTDPKAPIDIASDRLDVDDQSRKAIFTGGVIAKQATFTIRAQQLTAFYKGSAGLSVTSASEIKGDIGAAQLSKIFAKDKVQVVSADGQKATGDWADFDVKGNMAELGGNVTLIQGKNVVRGTKLTIDLNTGESTLASEPTASGAMVSTGAGSTTTAPIAKQSRPSAIFYPGEMKEVEKRAKGQIPTTEADGWQARTNQ